MAAMPGDHITPVTSIRFIEPRTAIAPTKTLLKAAMMTRNKPKAFHAAARSAASRD